MYKTLFVALVALALAASASAAPTVVSDLGNPTTCELCVGTASEACRFPTHFFVVRCRATPAPFAHPPPFPLPPPNARPLCPLSRLPSLHPCSLTPSCYTYRVSLAGRERAAPGTSRVLPRKSATDRLHELSGANLPFTTASNFFPPFPCTATWRNSLFPPSPPPLPP